MLRMALTVMASILATGPVSGAHVNPAVSVAFALRRDFPLPRVPGQVFVQLVGAGLACLVLHVIVPDGKDRLVVAATMSASSRRWPSSPCSPSGW